MIIKIFAKADIPFSLLGIRQRPLSESNCSSSTYFKMSECKDVSIINIIQVKFSCFLFHIGTYA